MYSPMIPVCRVVLDTLQMKGIQRHREIPNGYSSDVKHGSAQIGETDQTWAAGEEE